jgi:alginate O-acetyltransferase complex protein AlgI
MLLGSALVDYFNGIFIERSGKNPIRILGIFITLIFNLGLLISFKYSGFIVENVNFLIGAHFKKPDVLLPAGMSFYTFETISYTIDVYRGEVKAQRSLLKFLVFIVSFPRLVAGPIVRYSQLAMDLGRRVVTARDFGGGVTRFCRGLFKKVFIANVAGSLTAEFLDRDPTSLTLAGAWFGLLMFSIQIYYDFSGYSDMAIGLGKMLGFTYPENFKHPYAVRSVTDFWRRWHITLGAFFRDYVYIPLGGNRRHATRNIFVVWAITGLWHGPSWNFMLWGLYFGAILFLEKTLLLKSLSRLPALVQHAYALVLIVLGWAIFHFTDLHRLESVGAVLLGLARAPLTDYELPAAIVRNIIWIIGALLFCFPVRESLQRLWSGRDSNLAIAAKGVWVVSENLTMLALSVTLLVGSSYNPFIYYRF